MAEPQPRARLNPAHVINRTFGAIGADFPRLFLLTFVLSTVPIFLANIAFGTVAAPLYTSRDPAVLGIVFVAIATGAGLAGWAGSGGVMFAVLSRLRGDRASFGQCMLQGTRLFLPLLACAFIFHLGFFIGLVLLIVPGFLAATVMLPAGAVIIGERAGIGLALSRAEFLSRNNRWAILAAIIGFVFVNAVAGFTNNFLAQSIAAAAGGGDSIAAIIFGRLVTAVFTTLVVMIRSAGVATVYHELRTLKEGPASRTLAEIFD